MADCVTRFHSCYKREGEKRHESISLCGYDRMTHDDGCKGCADNHKEIEINKLLQQYEKDLEEVVAGVAASWARRWGLE